MFNFNITNKAKAQKINDRSIEANYSFKKVLTVPGFSEYNGAPVVFVQDTPLTVGAHGIRQLISVHCVKNDSAYANTHGTYFAITVGKKFLSMSHKEQQCALLYVTMLLDLRSGDDVFMKVGKVIIRNEFAPTSDIMGAFLSNTEQDDATIYSDDAINLRLLLANIFGARTTNKVVDKIENSVRKDLVVLQKYFYKSSKADKSTYKAKAYKDDVKATKKAYKVTCKNIKKVEKATKKTGSSLDDMAEAMESVMDAAEDLSKATVEATVVTEDQTSEAKKIRDAAGKFAKKAGQTVEAAAEAIVETVTGKGDGEEPAPTKA